MFWVGTSDNGGGTDAKASWAVWSLHCTGIGVVAKVGLQAYLRVGAVKHMIGFKHD